MTGEARELAVIVPAHDEELLVGACLDAVSVARDRVEAAHPDVRVQIVLVLDRCTDGTERIARSRMDVELVVCDQANVGSARAAGSRHAIASADVPLDRLWLAHTDADSRVDAGWLEEHLAHAASGAEVLLGSVRPARQDLSAEQHAAWELRAVAARALGAVPEQVHGANLGTLAAAYERIGGFRAMALAEDVDLVELARSAGLRIAVTDRAPVTTSARVAGRAPGGYASYVLAHY